jgi:hypothetical protein
MSCDLKLVVLVLVLVVLVLPPLLCSGYCIALGTKGKQQCEQHL